MPDLNVHSATRQQLDILIKNLQAMLQTLEEEHQALNTADAIALEEIAARKAQAVETIAHQYEDFRHGFGLRDEPVAGEANQSFTTTLIRLRKSTPELTERLDQLVTLTRACQQRNQDNGTLVNLGMHNCQANLGLLQRLSQPTSPSTYGPGAQPEEALGSLHRLQLSA